MSERKWTRVASSVTHNERLDTLDVTITPNGSPLRYVMQMDPREDGTLACVGIAIDQPVDDRRPITQPAVREFADRFAQFERAARNAVEMLGEMIEVKPALRTRRELSDEFLRDVLRRHHDYRAEGLPPTQTLARAEGVSDGTVKYWLRKARKLEEESS